MIETMNADRVRESHFHGATEAANGCIPKVGTGGMPRRKKAAAHLMENPEDGERFGESGDAG